MWKVGVCTAKAGLKVADRNEVLSRPRRQANQACNLRQLLPPPRGRCPTIPTDTYGQHFWQQLICAQFRKFPLQHSGEEIISLVIPEPDSALAVLRMLKISRLTPAELTLGAAARTSFLQPCAMYWPSASCLERQRPAAPMPQAPDLDPSTSAEQYSCTSSSHSSAHTPYKSSISVLLHARMCTQTPAMLDA